jgi:hypothetical protein
MRCCGVRGFDFFGVEVMEASATCHGVKFNDLARLTTQTLTCLRLSYPLSAPR